MPQVQLIDKRMSFGQVPLNLTTTKIAKIRNSGAYHAYFQVGLRLKQYGLRLKESGLRLEESGLRLEESGLRLEESGLRLEGSGLRLEGSDLRLEGSGLRLEGSGLRLEESSLRLEGSGLRLEESGLRLEGSGLRLASIRVLGFYFILFSRFHHPSPLPHLSSLILPSPPTPAKSLFTQPSHPSCHLPPLLLPCIHCITCFIL